MVTVAKDDYSLIYSVVEAFVAELVETTADVINEVDDAVSAYVSKTNAAKASVDSLLARRTINRVLPGQKLTDALKYTQDDVNEIIDDAIAETAFEFNVKIENVGTDFNKSINQSYDKINSSFRGVLLEDPDGFNAKLETELDTVSTKVDDASTEISTKITESVESIMEAKNDAINYVNQVYDTFVTNRPIIRLTGEVYLPATIILGQNNQFSVGLENIGGAKWRGWIGLRLVDEYGKKFFYNGRSSIINPIHPQTSSIVEINVPVPSEIDGYNVGSSVSLYAIINTMF